MKKPLQVQFLGMPPSPALASAAREKADKLELFRDDLLGCHVTIELQGRHREQGRQFAVRLSLTLPGSVLSVSRVHEDDAHLALRDAFDDLRRQVQDSAGRLAGQRRDLPPTTA